MKDKAMFARLPTMLLLVVAGTMSVAAIIAPSAVPSIAFSGGLTGMSLTSASWMFAHRPKSAAVIAWLFPAKTVLLLTTTTIAMATTDWAPIGYVLGFASILPATLLATMVSARVKGPFQATHRGAATALSQGSS